MNDTAGPVLYFDGICNLCNGAIQFVIRHDKQKKFRFSSLQSPAGQAAASALPQNMKGVDSILLYYNNQWHARSTAALLTLKLLGGPLSIFYGFIIVPRVIRDAVYRFIARNRYKWFGKQQECMVPTQDLKKRFLE